MSLFRGLRRRAAPSRMEEWQPPSYPSWWLDGELGTRLQWVELAYRMSDYWRYRARRAETAIQVAASYVPAAGDQAEPLAGGAHKQEQS